MNEKFAKLEDIMECNMMEHLLKKEDYLWATGRVPNFIILMYFQEFSCIFWNYAENISQKYLKMNSKYSDSENKANDRKGFAISWRRKRSSNFLVIIYSTL